MSGRNAIVIGPNSVSRMAEYANFLPAALVKAIRSQSFCT